MSNAPRYVTPYAYAYDPTGEPIPGALLAFYLNNSSTPAATYSDPGLSVPNTNPVVADSTGTFPAIFLDPTIIYKVILSYPPALGSAQVWSAYPVSASTTGNLNSYTATGTNAIVLTPFDGTPAITAYEDYQQFIFLAPAASTGDVTIQVGSLGVLPLYAGQSQVGSGQLLAGQLVVATYVSSVNGTSDPAFVLTNSATSATIVTGADVGTTNVYVLNPAVPLEQYSKTQLVLLTAANTNTTASGATLNISALGALGIVNNLGNGIGPGSIQAGGTYLLTCTGTAFQLINAGPRYSANNFSNVHGFALGGGTTASWTADAVTVFDGGGNGATITGVSLTPNISLSGDNGLDVGTVAPNTWYYAYALYNFGDVFSVFSLSASRPDVSGAYFARRIGTVRTDGSSDIVAFVQRNAMVRYVSTGAGLPQMAAAPNPSFPAYDALSVANFVPPTAGAITVGITGYANGAAALAPNGNFTNWPNTGAGIGTAPPLSFRSITNTQLTALGDIVLENGNIYWVGQGSSATCAVFCYGWTENF